MSSPIRDAIWGAPGAVHEQLGLKPPRPSLSTGERADHTSSEREDRNPAAAALAVSALCWTVTAAGVGYLTLVAHLPRLALPAAVTGSVLGLVAGGLELRYQLRQAHLQVIVETIVSIMPVLKVRSPIFRGARLEQLTVLYPPRVRDTNPTLRNQLLRALRDRMGGPVICSWNPQQRRMTLSRQPPLSPTAHAAAPPEQAVRIEQIVDLIFGDHARVTVQEWDRDRIVRFQVAYPPTTQDAADSWRIGTVATLAEKTGEQWTSSWEPAADRVTFARVVELPTKVTTLDLDSAVPGRDGAPAATDTQRRLAGREPADRHRRRRPERDTAMSQSSGPAVPAPAPTEPAAATPPIPFGIARGGKVIAWDPGSQAPHLLMAGATGSGKTTAIRTIVFWAVNLGYDVYICDPKRIEFAGLRGWPGVGRVATNLQAMADLIGRVHAEMHRRYEMVERDGPDALSELTPIILVIDEATELLAQLNQAWRAEGNKGVHPCQEQFGSIARLGRSARMFLLAGFQRPDTAIIPGHDRDNFNTRVACGHLRQNAKQMIGISQEPTPGIRGRAMADVGGGPVEVQIILSPDPWRKGTLADQEALARLRPDRDRPVSPLPALPTPATDSDNQDRGPTSAPSPPSIGSVGASPSKEEGTEADGLSVGNGELPSDGESTDVSDLERSEGGEREADRIDNSGSNNRDSEPADEDDGHARNSDAAAVRPTLRILPGGAAQPAVKPGLDPARQLVADITEALLAHRCHVTARNGSQPLEAISPPLGWAIHPDGSWTATGQHLGWYDERSADLLLVPERALRAARSKLTVPQAGAILVAARIVIRHDAEHSTTRVRVGDGDRPRVWVVPFSALHL